jgi:hypothetical protein
MHISLYYFFRALCIGRDTSYNIHFGPNNDALLLAPQSQNINANVQHGLQTKAVEFLN